MNIDKVVLAYSGGLDTSVILQWLKDTYECEVVTFTADLGQGEEVEPARAKALAMGVPESSIYIDDLREEFVRDFVFPMFRANTIYEGEYLLGTSIARPLIAKRLVEIAAEQGPMPSATAPPARATTRSASSSGPTRSTPTSRSSPPGGSGTCSAARSCWPTPPSATSRSRCHGAEVAVLDGRQPAAHLLRGRAAGGPVDRATGRDVALVGQPGAGPERGHATSSSSSARATSSPSTASDDPGRGPDQLNEVGGATASAGSTSSRTATSASRAAGAYETPGGTIMLRAHRAIESITLDREVATSRTS